MRSDRQEERERVQGDGYPAGRKRGSNVTEWKAKTNNEETGRER